MRGKKHATEDARRAAIREAQRRYREKHRDRVRAAQRAYIERHPERRKATRKAAWERIRSDPVRYAKALEQGRQSYARNPTTSSFYAFNWRGENRESVRRRNRSASRIRRQHTRDARREVAQYAPLLRADPCSYCGGPGGVIDHVVALASGGIHDVSNLTGACRKCNARKRALPLMAFLLREAT